MNHTISFNQLSKGDADKAGGKGASLGEMTQAGIPVPPGFVVSAQTFEYFIKETDLIQEIDAILDTVDHNTVHTVEDASEKIQALIHNATMPDDIRSEIEASFKELNTEFVAVRSSATAEDGLDHAWAGQLDSYLNVTTGDVVSYVQKCWASLFTPRAIFYRFEKELNTTHISVAVVVQKMVNSDISGIAFSVHPVTENRNQLIIEAGFGLGEAIVSGQITPDSYVVEKKEKNILDTNINTQNKALYRKEGGGNEWKEFTETEGSRQVLTETQILELSELIKKIEAHYNVPQDIEWAMEGGEFYIVQSRPITTLSHIDIESETGKNANRDYLSNLDLEVFFERKDLYPFVITLFHHVEGPVLKEILNFGFTHEVCIMKENVSSWCFTKKDLALVHEKHNEFIQSSSMNELEALIGKADSVYSSSEELLTKINKLSDDEFSYVLNDILEDIKEVLLYTTTIPFFLLVATDNKYGKINELKNKYITNSCEKLRADSKYNAIQDAFLNRLADIFSVKFNLNETQVNALAYEEVRDFAISGELSVDKNLDKRIKQSIFWIDPVNYNNHSFLYEDDVFEDIYKKIVYVDVGKTEGVRGQVANKGYAKGIVRIVNSPKEINKVLEGDIILSRNTNPSLMPAIKKAAAIVTDEGGIACHAAIVSRELNKPCIIGTKIGTKVFKDGDEVEVDADNGTVRILSQSDDGIFDFDPKKYVGLGQWVSPVMEYELWFNCFNTDESKELGVPTDELPWISIDGHYFMPKDGSYKFVKDKALVEFEEGKIEFANDIVGLAEELCLRCVDTSNKIDKELSFDEFYEYFKLMESLRFPWMSCFPLDEAATESLKKYAERESVEFEKITDTIEQLPNSLTDDQKVLQKFKEEIQGKGLSIDSVSIQTKDSELYSRIKEYQQKTEYVGTHHMWGDPRTMDKLLNAIEGVHELDDTNMSSDNSYTNPLLELMSRISKWRLECAQSSAMLAYKLRETLIGFADQLEITYDDIIFMTTNELKESLDKRFVDKDLIKERQKVFAIYRDKGEANVLVGDAYNKVADVFGLNESFEEVDKVTGQIGNKGVVIGEVAIIRKPQDMTKLKKGMVLVAPETTPDFIPAMSLASAFVTDIGGITSHAAIVAREMKKPCIIGTKIATKALKDGDQVEVDADNGIVRIIN